METFLQLVAKDLYRRTGGGADLSRTAVVFPNKRASLFFNEHLAAEAAGRPLWSPAYASISELFQQLSPYQLGDPIRLTCLLYRVYTAETGSTEPLDEFFFWGELLISDFDDIDKNMADADRLLGNLQELRDMDDYSFLTPEQEESVRTFFKNFSIEKQTELKQKFLTIWSRLRSMYHRFRQVLADAGVAYEGMMYRDVMERMDVSALPYDRIVFVGFNVLNKVESQLFRQLRDAGKALFYWDYDTYYAKPAGGHGLPLAREAGEFIVRNMQEFPNSLPPECFEAMRRQKTVRYVAAPTENAQARYIPQWYRSVSSERLRENAIVLCNEALLQPVLHSLPADGMDKINVTMGFPLSATPISGLVSVLLTLQTEGYDARGGRYNYQQIATVLRHPYIQRLSPQAVPLDRELSVNNRFFASPSELARDEELTKVFTPQADNLALCRWLSAIISDVASLYRSDDDGAASRDMYLQLYRESVFKAYTTVGRLQSLVESGELSVTTVTFCRLAARLLSSASIPFHGEPAIGVQIMGVLETRCLDFRNLLMLSVNEGMLPKSDADSSFIPYNLRKAFGLTTVEHQMSVYAYYFYRLIQRAESVTLMYNTADDGLNRGEMSRFMLQYLIESGQPVARVNLVAGQKPEASRSITVSKTPDMLRKLAAQFSEGSKNYLSPSAINKYFDCPLQFYYRYVAGIRKPDEVSADIDSAMFGTVFHKAAQSLYSDLSRRSSQITGEMIDGVLKDKQLLERYVDSAFKSEFFHIPESQKPEYNGTQLINRAVIIRFMRNMLRTDAQYAPFSIAVLEKEVFETFIADTSIGPVSLRVGGKIDRMDLKGDVLRIVDYKTGGKDVGAITTMDKAFGDQNRDGRVFQTFLYSAIVCRKRHDAKVRPALFMVGKTSGQQIELKMGKGVIDDFHAMNDEYCSRLAEIIGEIFDTDVPFAQTANKDKVCQYCDYAQLCKIRRDNVDFT